ncbi:hypothetical protein ACTQ34_01180 [Agathobaculum sp. LCP25S3_E8]|uniref:hypothetical protein n=1 Tax=Agathobaculum sp. LCP25S3_E8 TaxID=3438735 RepID=UPI003F8D9354
MEKGEIEADRTEWAGNGREWSKWGVFSIEKFRISHHIIIRSLQFLTDIGRILCCKSGAKSQKSAFFTEKLLVFAGIITGSLRIIAIMQGFSIWIEEKESQKCYEL